MLCGQMIGQRLLSYPFERKEIRNNVSHASKMLLKIRPGWRLQKSEQDFE